jgi:hypothetical protein
MKVEQEIMIEAFYDGCGKRELATPIKAGERKASHRRCLDFTSFRST